MSAHDRCMCGHLRAQHLGEGFCRVPRCECVSFYLAPPTASVPVEDEAIGEDEERAVAVAREEVLRGEVVSHAEVRRLLGLAKK